MSNANSDFQEFDRVYQLVSDAYENRFIDGDTFDQIGDAMCSLYPEAAKAIAVANGDMSEDDPIDMASASIVELFEVVSDKKQFTKELELVLRWAPKFTYTSELVADVISRRS